MASAVPTLDARNLIPARIEALGMTRTYFAEVCGSNKAEFSRLMSGAKPLGNRQTEDFYRTLDALEELSKMFDVVGIGWNDPETTRNLLKGFDLLPEDAKKNIQVSLEILKGGLSALAGEK